MSNIPTQKLSNGLEIPKIGLGTYKENNENVLIEAIKSAIKTGYRHFDCAYIYKNEETIGKAIRESIAESNGNLKREDFFITSKCWNTFHSREKAKRALDEILSRFGFDYIDLYLIHHPLDFKEDAGDCPLDEKGEAIPAGIHFLETYKALEECVKEGKTKSIGLSNFSIGQVDEVLKAAEIKPVCNQIEVHPLLRNSELVDFCQKNDVVVVAYAPLGAPDRSWLKPDDPVPLLDPKIIEIGKKYNKSAAQVILRWLLQRNIVVIPKSVTPKRIEENSHIFDFALTEDEMKIISGFECQFRFYRESIAVNHRFYAFN